MRGGRGRGGGRGSGKRPIEDDAPDPPEEPVRLPPAKRGPMNTRANRLPVQASPILPALQPEPAVEFQRPDPIDAQLLACFGGFSQGELNTLDNFFAWSTHYGEEGLIQGLLKLSVRMKYAIEQHRVVCVDLKAMNARVDALTITNKGAERIMEAVHVENAALKVVVIFLNCMYCAHLGVLQERVTDLEKEVLTIQASLKERESENSRLSKEFEKDRVSFSGSIDSLKATVKERESQNSRLSAELKSLKEELAASIKSSSESSASLKEIESRFEKEMAAVSASNDSLQKTVSELQQQADQFKLLESQFFDPISKTKLVCPVIQYNGVIRSFLEIINIWLNETDLGQTNAFRMFQCPVVGSFTHLAPFPMVDTVMKLAATIGVKTAPLVLFYLKQPVGDLSWFEFPLHEQLELIARLCTVYSKRKDETRPQEQRNVTVSGTSFMILMRAVAHGLGYRFECYGVDNNGGAGAARVRVKTVFAQGWDHLFADMDFAYGDD